MAGFLVLFSMEKFGTIIGIIIIIIIIIVAIMMTMKIRMRSLH